MKTILMIILALSSMFSSSYGASDDVLEIMLDRSKTDEKSSRPRSVVSVPIYAIWNDMDNGIYLSFLEDIGEYSITVLNMSTAEIFHDLQDSESGHSVLFLSGNSGYHRIIIETEYGDIFEGEFNVE